MVRARRIASAVTIAGLLAGASLTFGACGSDDGATENGSSSGFGGDGGPNNPPPVDVTPAKACTNDSECPNGGKCKDVGAAAKACVYAKSCTGGSGADTKCAEGKDCCETRAVPGGTFNDAALLVGKSYTFYGTTTKIRSMLVKRSSRP